MLQMREVCNLIEHLVVDGSVHHKIWNWLSSRELREKQPPTLPTMLACGRPMMRKACLTSYALRSDRERHFRSVKT